MNMIYTARDDSLYECFTDDELQRLHEIKSSPNWLPRTERKRNQQISVKITLHLKNRLQERCRELGISMSEYINALLEVFLSEDYT